MGAAVPPGRTRADPADTAERFETMVAEGRRGDAVEFFMAEVVGLPPEFVAGARQQPFWEATEGLAHTLAYDAGSWATTGSRGPRGRGEGGDARDRGRRGHAVHAGHRAGLADALPDGHVSLLDGQGHNVDPTVLAPVLKEFFAA